MLTQYIVTIRKNRVVLVLQETSLLPESEHMILPSLKKNYLIRKNKAPPESHSKIQAVFIIWGPLSLDVTGYCGIRAALWVDSVLLGSTLAVRLMAPHLILLMWKHQLNARCWQLFLWHFASVHSMSSYLLAHWFLSNWQISFIAEWKFDYVQNSVS